MIAVIIFDGLRPDSVNSGTTPFLYRKAQSGVFCSRFHSVFPTSTRVNSASLATGCYPAKHGLVDNELYVPEINPSTPLSCGDWDSLEQIARTEGRDVLDMPTYGQIIADADKKAVFAGCCSTGTAHLSDPSSTSIILHWSDVWPVVTCRAVLERGGSFPKQKMDQLGRARFILSSLKQCLFSDGLPEVLTIWFSEPDASQHRHGLGSPQTLRALLILDQLLEEFITELEVLAGQELVCLFLSDHGFVTISEQVDLGNELFHRFGQEQCVEVKFVLTPNGLHLSGRCSKKLIQKIVGFLSEHPWIGGVFVRDDLLDHSADFPPQSWLFCGPHRRSPEITFTWRYNRDSNHFGVEGSIVHSSPKSATHGSASPYELHNTLIAWGSGIRQGVISEVPCGIVDIAPTILHLLGLRLPSAMDGRVLVELLDKRPLPEQLTWTSDQMESVVVTSSGRIRVQVNYSVTGINRYIDEVRCLREP